MPNSRFNPFSPLDHIMATDLSLVNFKIGGRNPMMLPIKETSWAEHSAGATCFS